jgi:hypothetical protein
MYSDIMTREGISFDISYCKVKVPLKIKKFIWYLRQGVVLIQENLSKRKWKGATKCCVCREHETIQHLFFECLIATQGKSSHPCMYNIYT